MSRLGVLHNIYHGPFHRARFLFEKYVLCHDRSMKRNGIVAVIAIVGVFLGAWYLGSFSSKNPGGNQSLSTLEAAKDSKIIELKDGDTFDMTASIVKKNIAGNEVKMLAYNGTIPGPTIKVRQGSHITLQFHNKTDIGTTIHSHGVRLDNAFDGVPDVTQKLVMPGESFTYQLVFPDVGVFWYHPHFREDYTQDAGLYGNYIVEPQNSSYWEPVNAEESLVLDDILIENGGIVPYDERSANHTLMGRFGNIMLVNGVVGYQTSANKGEVKRLYVTNIANVRPFNLAIPGAKMKLVGADGGAYEHEQFVDSVLLGPSERAIIDVLFSDAGAYKIQSVTPGKTYALGSVNVSDVSATPSYAQRFGELRSSDTMTHDARKLRQFIDKGPDKEISLSMGMQHGMMGMSGMSGMGMMNAGKIEWEDHMPEMNAASTPQSTQWIIADDQTGKTNMDIQWQFHKGDLVKVRIVNTLHSMHPMQHPIHFHGQRFVVLATNGVANNNLVWKDTTLIQAGDTVDILVEMSNPGSWMAHCHIPEHLESGMMFGFQVI